MRKLTVRVQDYLIDMPNINEEQYQRIISHSGDVEHDIDEIDFKRASRVHRTNYFSKYFRKAS